MGLDVSLRYCANRAAELAKQTAAEQFSEAAWEKAGGYNDLSDAQRETVREAVKAYNEQNGLDEYGSSNDITHIEEDSKLYPEHMFKIGYLRSSYNSAGINSVLERAGCMTLYDIFEPKDGEYYVDINWAEAQLRAHDAIEQYREHLSGDMAGYDVIRVTDFGSNGCKTDAEALIEFQKQLNSHKDKPAGFRSYGCREGDFYLDGITVCGIIPNRGFGGGTFLITKEAAKPIEEDYYLQALIVTKEMIDYVLAQKDPENYFLGWSA